MRDEWDNDNHHPACPGGCGQLADECACHRRRASVVPVQDDGFTYDPILDDTRTPCRWRGCLDEAIHHGLCDAHLGTL